MADYCIDSSAFITAWRFNYPPDVFPGIWERLDVAIQEGLVITSDEVIAELEIGGDELFAWMHQRNRCVVELDDGAQARMGEILQQYPRFLADAPMQAHWADPYVVTLAEREGLVIIQEEKPTGHGAHRMKIPNVASDLGIPCCSFLDFAREQGWRF